MKQVETDHPELFTNQPTAPAAAKGDQTAMNASEELSKKIREYRVEHDTTMAEAIRRTLELNPELSRRYNEEVLAASPGA
jgi:hypothetical protein